MPSGVPVGTYLSVTCKIKCPGVAIRCHLNLDMFLHVRRIPLTVSIRGSKSGSLATAVGSRVEV